jgi:hypothetical protein
VSAKRLLTATPLSLVGPVAHHCQHSLVRLLKDEGHDWPVRWAIWILFDPVENLHGIVVGHVTVFGLLHTIRAAVDIFMK